MEFRFPNLECRHFLSGNLSSAFSNSLVFEHSLFAALFARTFTFVFTQNSIENGTPSTSITVAHQTWVSSGSTSQQATMGTARSPSGNSSNSSCNLFIFGPPKPYPLSRFQKKKSSFEIHQFFNLENEFYLPV